MKREEYEDIFTRNFLYETGVKPEPDQPQKLTCEDIDKAVEIMLNHEINTKCCDCGKRYLPNYDCYTCDECYFSQFPKEEVTKFYQDWIDKNL